MKYYVKWSVMALACGCALAQSTTSTYTTDLNGRRVEAATVVSTDGERTDITRNLNGREIPLEQTERHVLRKDASGSVTETIVRRYDRNGQLVSTEKIVAEEQNRPGGSTSHSTTYRTDLNGRMQEAERKTVETLTQGAVTNTQTVIERPTIGGGLQTVEKRTAATQKTDDTSHTDETVYRRDGNGAYQVAERTVADAKRSGNQTTETSAMYLPIANVSSLQLSRQQVTTTTTRPDGSETQEVNYYLPSLPGVVRSSESSQLSEQDTIQRRKQPDGSVVETITARRADNNHPQQLGPPEQLSETICKGNCTAK